MTRIGIITPGGDAPGMNACIRAVVRKCLFYGFEPYGVHRGYAGLIDGEIDKIERSQISNIIQLGGTILHSTRCKEIHSEEGITKAAKNLKNAGIEHLIIIGGDGSFQAGMKISEHGMNVIGCPASIDNDVYGTDETIGFNTALDTAVSAIDKIRDTATSFDRIFMVEVMGREHGFLALSVGIASGAEIILTPEKGVDIEEIIKDLEEIKSLGKTSVIIIFAEGCGDSHSLGKEIEERTGYPTRVSDLGYIQRGGNPTGRSRILGSLFGSKAVDLIKEGAENQVVVTRANKIEAIPIAVCVRGNEFMDEEELKLAKQLSIMK